MLLLDQVRQQYPTYNEWSDEDLLSGLRQKFYTDMSDDEFAQAVQEREENLRSELNGGAGGEFMAGVYGGVGSLNRAGQAVSQALGADGAAQWFDENARAAARRAQAADPVNDRILGAESVGEAARGVRQALVGNAPQMGATLAAGAAGFAAGGPLGALIGGLAVNYPLLFGENVQEQIEQQGKIESPGKAAGYAVPGALLDSAVNMLIPGGKSLGGMISKMFREGAEEGAEAGAKSTGRRIATRAAAGALVEAPTELAQTALTIHQAGGDPFAPENRMRLAEAAVAGAIVGGVAGGGLSLLERGSPKEDDTGQIDPATLDAADRENALRGLAADPEVRAVIGAQIAASGMNPRAEAAQLRLDDLAGAARQRALSDAEIQERDTLRGELDVIPDEWWSSDKAQTFLDRIIERRNRQVAKTSVAPEPMDTTPGGPEAQDAEMLRRRAEAEGVTAGTIDPAAV